MHIKHHLGSICNVHARNTYTNVKPRFYQYKVDSYWWFISIVNLMWKYNIFPHLNMAKKFKITLHFTSMCAPGRLLCTEINLNITSQWRIQDLTLGGAWTLSTGGGRKSLKLLKVEVKVMFLACFVHFSIKIILNINR